MQEDLIFDIEYKIRKKKIKLVRNGEELIQNFNEKRNFHMVMVSFL